MYRFQNLKKLHCRIRHALTDKCILEIKKCKNLEDLAIYYSNYKLSVIGESYFAELKNIRSIKFLSYDKDVSHILPTLKNCKSLEYIEIPATNIPEYVDKMPIQRLQLRKNAVNHDWM